MAFERGACFRDLLRRNLDRHLQQVFAVRQTPLLGCEPVGESLVLGLPAEYPNRSQRLELLEINGAGVELGEEAHLIPREELVNRTLAFRRLVDLVPFLLYRQGCRRRDLRAGDVGLELEAVDVGPAARDFGGIDRANLDRRVVG
jgi:hypothetical protein